jgi:acyl carrier protein
MTTDLRAAVSNTVRYIICEAESDQPLDEATRLVGDLGLDSLDKIELIQELEDEFDVFIDEDDLSNVKTVGDLVRLVDDARKS